MLWMTTTMKSDCDTKNLSGAFCRYLLRHNFPEGGKYGGEKA